MRVDAVTISLSLVLHFNQTSCEKNVRGVEDHFKEVFIHYDKHIIPFERVGQPVLCEVQYLILNLADMKPINNHITVEAIIYSSWKDHRLLFQTNNATNNYSLTSDAVSKIWAPDLLFWSFKSGEISSVTRKNIHAQIRPDGQVLLSQRHMMTIYCNMKTFLFPFDDQYCNITILSFAYSRVWLQLFWNSNAVRTRGNFDKGKFTLISYKLKKDVVDFNFFGFYDVLQLTMRLRRKAMPYVIRIYIPLFIIVIMSWVGFWISHHSVPARTLVSSCLVLTMIMFITSIQKSLPRTGELRAVDLHMMVCFLYVFAGLVEYAMVQTIDIRVKIIEQKKFIQDEERRKTTEHKQLNEGRNALDPTEIIDDPAQEQEENLERTKRIFFCCNPLEAVMQRLTDLHMVHQNDYHILDKISKVAFPLTFIIYNAVYFITILIRRKNEQ